MRERLFVSAAAAVAVYAFLCAEKCLWLFNNRFSLSELATSARIFLNETTTTRDFNACNEIFYNF